MRFRLSAAWLPLILAVFFTGALNLSFWEKMIAALKAETTLSAGFAFSLPLAMIAIFYLIFNLLTFRPVEKIIFAVLIPLSAIANYATHTYGVYLDNNMIANVMETTTAEAGSYLNLPFTIWFGATGVLPLALLFAARIDHPPFPKNLIRKGAGMAAALALMGVIWMLYSVDYMAFFRNHKGIEKNLVPSYVISSSVKYFKQRYINAKIPFTETGLDAARAAPSPGGKPDVMVFVLGETARGMNYELNGYPRPTNAHTRDKGLISFADVSSCGTATATSVPCMFSFMGREAYKESIAKKQSNTMDILARTGLKTLWVENDEGCKSVCDRIPTIITDKSVTPYCNGEVCRDDMLLNDLPAQIDAMKDTGGVIVIHIMGSHGPTYYKRYPDEHRFFKPDCPRSDIQNCTTEEIVNTYDNTILFTDYVMAKVIDILAAKADTVNPAMLYVSDHGESLGENGIYLHGMPYAIAPREQTHVPLIFWAPDQTAAAKGMDLSCLKDTANKKSFSHDHISHSLLGYMDVRTSLYNPALDLFEPCRK
jgi:lipid A ethanolaminephosphotransferase